MIRGGLGYEIGVLVVAVAAVVPDDQRANRLWQKGAVDAAAIHHQQPILSTALSPILKS
jgi:hypothetical protein